MDTVIEARSLVKRYGLNNVVDGLHLEIPKGQCFGILGPDGAGKTSLLRILYGSSGPSAGELFILGLNVRKNNKKIKAQVGVLPQENGLDPDFCVLDNLLVFSRYHGFTIKQAKVRARELLRFMHLEEFDDRPVEFLSPGKKRKLAFARALLNRPQILFLDEPTAKLNQQSRIRIWEAIEELKRQGTTIILSTKLTQEVQRLCDQVMVMDKGKALVRGVPSRLIHDYVGHEVVEFFVRSDELEYYLTKIKDRFQHQVLNNKIRLFVKDGQDGKAALDLISSENIIVRRAALDDVFLKFAGYEL